MKNLDLETLKAVKLACDLYSDGSSSTLGYRWLCERIKECEVNSLNEEAVKRVEKVCESNYYCEYREMGKCKYIDYCRFKHEQT